MTQSAIKQSQPVISKEYKIFFKEVKERILSAQLKAAAAVNHELITLYWEIGSAVGKKQEKEGWGAKAVEKLAHDLKSSFPHMKGFSIRNIRFMVQFAREYDDCEIVKQLVSQIPWGHNILIIQKLNLLEERLWYIKKTIEHGWSRSVLDTWISSNLYERQEKSVTNFTKTLPTPLSDLANQTLKDPYCFDFLTLRDEHDEHELESGLLDHIQKFLLELGVGFSFITSVQF